MRKTQYYQATITKINTLILLDYVQGKFKRLEIKKGSMNAKTLNQLFRIVPLNESDFAAYEKEFAGKVEYSKLDKKHGGQKSKARPSGYSKFNSAWFTFYRNQHDMKPKFDGAEGKALKSIIDYLTEISGSENAALELWQAILQNWEQLDPFHQKNCNLKYINSNLNKIMTNVKDRNQKGAITDSYKRGLAERLGIV